MIERSAFATALHTLRLFAVISLLYGIYGCTLRTQYPQPPAMETPNEVRVSERLLTSGEPPQSQLRRLTAERFALVIDLAPKEGAESLPSEARVLAERDIAYVAIPVDIKQPKDTDFELFSAALNGTHGSVWIHCQVNQRASLFTFLYRVIYLGVDGDEAYEKVIEVWVPPPRWIRFANRTLSRHQIAFRL